MNAQDTNVQKEYKRFCGIDVAKDKHVACVIDLNGAILTASQSFTNSAAGFDRLLQTLRRLGNPQDILIAMDPTGYSSNARAATH